ncbi:heterokaryon incompatibility protein [Colletotrichum fioriniae PJ7]|uniref:Heterokaryon incompatibility protein n=1 Tax=Colletotrichum fioriniae PJ7 TaxID=1445577 RepID=A0A010Q8T7_9PEZI|nr:heterokaryon incompatibility protein [Colletotrichum fioriniae PJ7]
MMSVFTYNEKLALNEIRLIQLFPGEWLDGLESRLYVADRSHKYQALSYAWGSSKRSNQITVNGKIHKITFNLDRALRAVRRQIEPITLWVDSICIDQDDAAEKGHQVGSMHDIFGSATEVIAYVGDGLDRSRKDYSRRFEKLGENPLTDLGCLDILNSDHTCEKHWDTLKNSEPGSLTEHEEILCLYSLFALLYFNSYDIERNLSESQLQVIIERMRLFAISDWWSRMWIVQEACVARRLTMAYGRALLPFHYVESARMHLQSPKINHPELTRVIRFLAGRVDAISPARRLREEEEETIVGATTSSSLLWLLRRFRHRKSSEPRDKVFALLKLAEDMKSKRPFLHNQLSIQANYEYDVSELFSHATFEIIRHTGLLWMTTPDLLSKSRIDIPSWVPDWSSEHMASGFNQRRYRLQEEASLGFNASRARFCHHPLNSEDRIENLFPRQHLEGLLNDNIAEWKPVHFLPTMIKYTSSPPFEEHRQQSALILKGISCGVVEITSQVIRSDLSNVGQAIAQVQAFYGRKQGRQNHREPFLEAVATCLSMSMQVLSDDDGSLRTLDLDRRRELSYWAFGQYAGALMRVSRYENLLEDFCSAVAACPDGYTVDAIPSTGGSLLRFKASTVPDGDQRQWNDDLDTDESYKIASLPKDYDLLEWTEPEGSSWMEDTVRTMAAGNRLFVTDRGQIGLGPGSMCVGDELCVLEGGLMPYILRKHFGTICTESSRVHQMESIKGVHRYTMVGSCYVDGIMTWGDEAHGWGDSADDIEELDSKLRRRLHAPELAEVAFLLV